jgi:hypothetical protein
MDDVSFSTTLTWLLIAAFLGAGLLNLIGRRQLREVYARCQYPTGYRYAAGIVYIGAAVLLAGPYRMLGLALAAVLLFLLIVTLLDHREYGSALSRVGLLGALWVSVMAGAA